MGKNKTKQNKTERHLNDLWDNKEFKAGMGYIFKEIITEAIPSLMKNINPQIQNAQWTSNRTQENTPTHIMIKLLEPSNKRETPQEAREGKKGYLYKQYTRYLTK